MALFEMMVAKNKPSVPGEDGNDWKGDRDRTPPPEYGKEYSPVPTREEEDELIEGILTGVIKFSPYLLAAVAAYFVATHYFRSPRSAAAS
ncbi:MAG: hypothetical protein AAB439_01965 [Patescibacteria group bacterium]